MATEKCQHIIWQILKDYPGAHNIHDDIRVVGASEEEHDERLNQVMKKLEESGLTLNYEKCQIGVSSMKYLGNVLTDEGLQVSGDKVEAIVAKTKGPVRAAKLPWFGTILFKVHSKLRDHCQPTVGSNQITCQMEMGHC